MPDQANKTLSNTGVSPFIGLQSYSETQADIFFGRDIEIDNLTKLVESNTLTIIFGKSGTGKTSLLNAGVFPKLRKNYCLPFRIRLEFGKNSPDLITQIKKVLKSEIDKYGFAAETYPSSETLWEYFHREPLWKTITPILIFDQFEEIFTLAKTNDRFAAGEQKIFWEELSDLIENSIPEKLKDQFLNHKEQIDYSYKNQKIKILFSFREEFLPEFESITSKIPSIKYSRFRLLPMNGYQAYDVITKTWKENINPAEAKKIVSFLTNEKNTESYELVTVEPSLLSQVCSYIDKERIEEVGGKVSAELLKKYPKETILRSIYDQALFAANNAIIIPNTKEKAPQNPVKEFLEEKMITTEGYRTKYNLTEKDDYLKPSIDVLISKYFLREDDKAIELTHDVLAPIIKSDREKRRNELALAEERKKARKKALLLLLASILLASGIWAFFSAKSVKAFQDMKIAQKTADSLNIQIKKLKETSDSLAPNYTKNSSPSEEVNRLKHKADSLQHLIDSMKSVPLDSNNINNEEIRDSIRDLLTAISQKNILLKNNESEIQNLKKGLTDGSIKAENLQRENSALKEEINRLNKRIEELKNDSIKTNERIRILRDSITYLQQTIKKLGDVNNDLINKGPNPMNPGNLRIQIYNDSASARKVITNDKLDIYIIPMTLKNKELLNNNSKVMFATNCSKEFEDLLKKIGGYQKAFYLNGYYYFPEVIQNGKYKIKICSILDGYYDLKMPSSNGIIYWKRENAPKIEIKLGKF
jgi:Novel STAND NTPase 1